MGSSRRTVRRLYSLTNTASGTAAEIIAAGALLRAGCLVAKPYWNDDEIDLLVFSGGRRDLVWLPVQVKSIQFCSRSTATGCTRGLRKKHLERQPFLCLIIYAPRNNKLWLIPGARTIKQVHQEGVRKNRRRKPYSRISTNGEVRIYVDISKEGDKEFDAEWLIDTDSPSSMTAKISELGKAKKKHERQVAVLASQLFD